MKKLSFTLYFIFCLCDLSQGQSYFNRENLRSDSIDVLHESIIFNSIDFSTHQIDCRADIKLASLQDQLNYLPFDLKGLIVDSVLIGLQSLNYTHNNDLLMIELNSAVQTGDTVDLSIFYHGSPAKDPSNWGGFYFNSGYAFNLGVGFESYPHNFGRSWFPCFDSFKEKATYTLEFNLPLGYESAANGYLVLDTIFNNSRKQIWELDLPINSYLVGISVGAYKKYESQLIRGIDSTDIALYSFPNDSVQMSNSMANLEQAITIFDSIFGPEPFGKVGYVQVPFNSGAMEHATNIAYPNYAVDGTLTSETLMAHELAHHWWGDWVTCLTPEDMWLNEGWASYSSYLFLESKYNRDSAIYELNQLLFDVIRTTHVNEGGYKSVSGVDSTLTYGSHVYDKGALMAHALRGYLTDSLFTTATSQFLAQNSWDNMSSLSFQNYLSTHYSSRFDDFFKDWIYKPGFINVSLKGYHVTNSSGNYSTEIHLKQGLRGTNQYFTNLPIEVTLSNYSGHSEKFTVTMQDSINIFHLSTSFAPEKIELNKDNTLPLAYNTDYIDLNSSTLNTSTTLIELNSTAAKDQQIKVQHHWTAPTGQNLTSGYALSKERYWAIVPTEDTSTFNINATLWFKAGNGANNLDSSLLQNGNDSLVLLYRSNANQPWEMAPNSVKNNFGNSNGKIGYFELNGLQFGQYCFGNYDQNFTSIRTVGKEEISVNNPVLDELIIQSPFTPEEVYIYDMNGKILLKSENTQRIRMGSLTAGYYLVVLKKDGKTIWSHKIVKA